MTDDDSHGQFFHSKHFPSLKFFIHLGFDNELGEYMLCLKAFLCVNNFFDNLGCLNFKELFLRSPPTSYVNQLAPTISDDAALYVEVKKGTFFSITLVLFLNNEKNRAMFVGGNVSSASSHKNVLDLPSWSFAKKIINNEYFEAV